MDETTRTVRLDQMGVPRLMFALLRNRFTGTATLPQTVPEPGTRTVWFRGGMPVFTDWVSPQDVLGEVLLHKAMVSPQAYEQALARMARDGGLLGQVLLAAGTLDVRTLSDALREQCHRKLVRAFALREGTSQVVAVEHGRGKGDELAGQVNVLRLIAQGVAAHYDEARIRAEMGAGLAARVVAGPSFAKYKPQFGFRSEDEVALRQLARGTSLEELAVPGTNRKRLVQLVYVLWATQMLVGESDAASLPPPSAAVAPPRPAAAPPRPAPAPSPPARSAPPSAPPPARPSETTKIPEAMLHASPADAAAAAAFEGDLAALEAKVGANAHAFALFDLPLDAERKQIRGRWADLSARFHPDRLGAEGLDHLKPRVEKVFAALSEAHGVLMDAGQRENLRKIVESGVDPSSSTADARVVVRNAIEAEMIAREADKLLKAGSFARALAKYEEALALHAAEAEIQAAAAWCRYQVQERSAAAADAALEVLAAAVAEQPKCARAHYYRALILLGREDEAGARVGLRAALEANPRFTDAERQLRALDLRRKATAPETDPKRKSGLRGLFGRKP